jgi:esterase/lipase superfamily enzyme
MRSFLAALSVIPHPIIYHDPRFEGLTYIPPDQRTLTTDIFYATTRGGDGPPDHRTYTNDVGDAIRLGVASVRFGDTTTSWDDLAAEVRTEQHTSRLAVQVGQARELGTLPTAPDVLSDHERPFIEAINSQLARSPRKDVTVYVHGFRVDFEISIAILGSFHHYSLRRGAFVAFNWPSRQSLWLYGAAPTTRGSHDTQMPIERRPTWSRSLSYRVACRL